MSESCLTWSVSCVNVNVASGKLAQHRNVTVVSLVAVTGIGNKSHTQSLWVSMNAVKWNHEHLWLTYRKFITVYDFFDSVLWTRPLMLPRDLFSCHGNLCFAHGPGPTALYPLHHGHQLDSVWTDCYLQLSAFPKEQWVQKHFLWDYK